MKVAIIVLFISNHHYPFMLCLPHFAALVREEVESRNVRLPEYGGELFDNLSTLVNILSNKITQKQDNWRAQTYLEKYASPLSALVWAVDRVAGKNELFPHRERTHRYDHEMFWYAWTKVLQNHAHDSIGGCSVEGVHRDVDHRFYQAKQVAQSLIDESLSRLAHLTQISRPGDSSAQLYPLISILNPLPFRRHEGELVVVTVQLHSPLLQQVRDGKSGFRTLFFFFWRCLMLRYCPK